MMEESEIDIVEMDKEVSAFLSRVEKEFVSVDSAWWGVQVARLNARIPFKEFHKLIFADKLSCNRYATDLRDFYANLPQILHFFEETFKQFLMRVVSQREELMKALDLEKNSRISLNEELMEKVEECRDQEEEIRLLKAELESWKSTQQATARVMDTLVDKLGAKQPLILPPDDKKEEKPKTKEIPKKVEKPEEDLAGKFT